MNRLDNPNLKTYNRRHKTVKTIPWQSESLSPETDHSAGDTFSSPIDDLNLPIALQKGIDCCTKQPISSWINQI